MARPPFTLSLAGKNNDKERSGQAHEARLETTTGGNITDQLGRLYIPYKHIINTYYTCSLIISCGITPALSWSPCSWFTSRSETYPYFPGITYTSLVICLSLWYALVVLVSSSIADNHSITGICMCCVVYYSMMKY